MFSKIVVIISVFLLVSWVVDQIIRKRMTADLIEVPTKLSSYYVKNLPNQKEAADLLEVTRLKMFQVITHLREMDQNDIPPGLQDGIRRLISKHCHDLQLTELDAAKFGNVAMNQNKGKNFYFCLRACPDCLELTHSDRLFIVALHELAHSCTKDYDPLKNGSTLHSEKFKLYEGFLIYTAEKINLLDSSSVVGSDFCGVRLPALKVYRKSQ